MAFEDIIQKIVADGEAAVAAVQSESAAAVARIREQSAREIAAAREQMHRQAERLATERADRILTLAHLEHRKALLAEKQRALAAAFAAAAERLTTLPRGDTWDLLRHVILERVESGREEIVPGRAHAELLDQAFVAELNSALGERGHLTLAAEPGNFDHGVVLREGRKEINGRMSVLLAETRERLVQECAERLFPEDAPADA